MQVMQSIFDTVADLTIAIHLGSESPEFLQSIEFFSSAGTPLQSKKVYLLTPKELPELIRCAPLPSAVCFIACGSANPPPLPEEVLAAATVVFVRGALLPLYTRLNQWMDTQRIRRRIDDIAEMAETMQQTPEQYIRMLSAMLDISVFILNASYQPICSGVTESDESPYTNELSRTGMLSAESVHRLRSGSETHAALNEFSGELWTQSYVLLLWSDDLSVDTAYLCRRLTDYTAAYQIKNVHPDIPPALIDRQLNRVLEGKVSDETEILSLFDVGTTPVWFSVLTLGADPGVRWSAEAYKAQADLLQAAFRDIRITVVNSRVAAVSMMPVYQSQDMIFTNSFFYRNADTDSRAYADGWDPERLERELRQLGVYLCHSTVFRACRLLPIEYGLVSDALDIAIKLDGCRGRHTVDYHDYSSFITVKFALERFLQHNEPRNIWALLNPEMVTLLFHDIHYRTDLTEVLLRYYTYGDVNLTAQSLYVHRNTVYNRLKTIQKLLGVDLEDFAVRSRYLPSLQIYYYCEKCLGLNMRALV